MKLEDYNEMTNEALKEKIIALKKEKNAVILAHSYQSLNIHPIADYIGDSLYLARQAATTDADIIVFCGVDFMAESAKILSPDKKVLLPNREAACPMAHMVNIEELKKLKAENPGSVVVTYINSTAAVKAESDVTCTSANAVSIVKHFKDKTVIFAPDKNLGAYCQANTDGKVILWDGYCYVHNEFAISDVYIAKSKHPDCLLLVHPEAPQEVVEVADFVGSTSQIIKFVEDNVNDINETAGVIIGTEVEIGLNLQQRFPNKRIYNLADHAVCTQMKKTTLANVCHVLDTEENEITVPKEVSEKAINALNNMLELSKKIK